MQMRSTNGQKQDRGVWLLAVGVLFCGCAMLGSLLLGSTSVSVSELWQGLLGKEGLGRTILLYVRVPRTLAAMLAGAALASAGAVLQNVLANPLASPGIIGVNAGAGLGVTVCCALGVMSGWRVSVAAFLGSLLAVFLILLFSVRTGASRTTVILGGVALNSMLNAASESISVLVPDVSVLNAEFRVGGFSAVSYTRLVPAGVLILIGLCLLFTLQNELEVVTLGDETAQSVGLPVRRYRVLFLLLAALLAGSAVSFSGLLGFVGLIVPQLVRRLSGKTGKWLLPLSVLFGAGFVALCDTAARVLFAPYEMPVGILMAAIGGPVFVWLLVRLRGGHRHA